MKKLVQLVICCVFLSQLSFAQTQGDTTLPQPDTNAPVVQDAGIKKDTGIVTPPVVRKKRDTSVKVIHAAVDTSVAAVAPVAGIAGDSVVPASQVVAADTLKNLPVANFLPLFQAALAKHPYFNILGKPRAMLMQPRVGDDKDDLFYFMAGLIFFFALIRIFFYKYLQNVMTLFFRVTMRQAQLREQLSQAALPSLLLNILFVITGGMFLAFLALNRHLTPETNIWLLWIWGCALVLAVYLGKFIILKVVGWIFNVSNATDTYIFLIFMVNKMAGIFLIPVLVMMAFPYSLFLPIIETLTIVGLAVLLGYRFVISYKPIRNEIKVSRFHFFVYLCAFEVAPLLLIYKVLLIFVERSY